MTGPKTDGANQRSAKKSQRKRKRSESSSSEEEWTSSGESTEEETIYGESEEQQFASGPWTYDLDEMRIKKEFEIADVCVEMNPSDCTVGFVQENGLKEPLLFRDSVNSLGMKMPKNETLTVSCVLKAVGDRQIEVVDVMTQSSRQMMLSDFVDYYETPAVERENLLNVLSLEFSLTPLAKRIRAPAVAREIDWVELYWPKELRNSPYTFPKVQNYCLMSVEGSFTDFHIDFGGTSVWYHVYKGRKTFWVIEPTEENIRKYEKWILEGTQHEEFFGLLVDKCARIELYEGYTFIIPSGWIHAVYTPEDSLVFGGNFLHSFSIPMQIRISQSEDTLMIKRKYRYPKYREMLWYVVENIVKKATGLNYEINKTTVKVAADQKDINNEISKEKSFCGMMHTDVTTNDVKNGIKQEIDQTVAVSQDIVHAESDADAGSSTAAQVKNEEVTENKDEAIAEKLCSGENKPMNAEEKNLTFDDEYIVTISKRERDGYNDLLAYMRESVKSCCDPEGQKMRNVLDIFERVLSHEVPEHFIIEKEKKKRAEAASAAPTLNQWVTAFGKNKSSATKAKIIPKEKIIESPQLSRPKPPKPKVKSSKKPDHHKPDGPLIVGGIPPAIMPADAPQAPNPYGYDPLASVTPLGHKQLPSAYRRTPDMAKAPPSQKFRLQPQRRKAAVEQLEKKEVTLEKTPNESVSTNNTTISESPDFKSVEHGEVKATARSGNEMVFHHGEFWRSHHDREKDNQRDNRHSTKEEYPELQYRSPLARPGPSNSGMNLALKSGFHWRDLNSGKAFRRRYTGSFAGRSSVVRGDVRRASDSDSAKKDSTHWRTDPQRKSNSSDVSSNLSQPFIQYCPQKVPAATHSAPDDPRLPSAGLSRWSPGVKNPPAVEREGVLTSQPVHVTEGLKATRTTTVTAQLGVWKSLSTTAGPSGNSQYVPLLNRERNYTPATQRSNSGKEPSVMASPMPVLTKQLPSVSEPPRSPAAEPAKKTEIKKPEIRELLVTLNEDKEDRTGIVETAEELAELTKVFDVDERDLGGKKAEQTMVVAGERILKRQYSNDLEKGVDSGTDRHPSQETVDAETVPPSSKLPRIPAETALQNLSSLTAEFNAVED